MGGRGREKRRKGGGRSSASAGRDCFSVDLSRARGKIGEVDLWGFFPSLFSPMFCGIAAFYSSPRPGSDGQNRAREGRKRADSTLLFDDIDDPISSLLTSSDPSRTSKSPGSTLQTLRTMSFAWMVRSFPSFPPRRRSPSPTLLCRRAPFVS